MSTIRILIGLPLLTMLIGCEGLHTRKLSGECTDLYNDVVNVLHEASVAKDDSDKVLKQFSPLINGLAERIPVLRQALADGGEAYRWHWPRRLRSTAIERYQTALTDLPTALFPLGEATARNFDGLKWFCNRAVSATMPALQDSTTAWDRFRDGYGLYDALEIKRAMLTREELVAYSRFQAEFQ